MKTRNLPQAIRIPLAILTAILASVMFIALSVICLKIGEWLISIFG